MGNLFEQRRKESRNIFSKGYQRRAYEMIYKCVECKKNPIHNQKYGLCQYCYSRMKKKEYDSKKVILYECTCKIKKKEKHHPDDSLKNLVVLLCKGCHMAEHIRLRKTGLSKPYSIFPYYN